MNATHRLLGLFAALVIFIISTVILFGSATETALRAAFDEAASAALVVFIVFAALAMDVVLPLPSSVVSAAAVSSFGPALGVAIIWLGMTTGHFLGFLLGARYGSPAVTQIAGEKARDQLNQLGRTIGMSAVLAVTRAVPVLSETSAIFAGASGMAAGRFLFIVATANLGVALVYAVLIGSASNAASLALVFIASIAVPAISYCVLRLVATVTSRR